MSFHDPSVLDHARDLAVACALAFPLAWDGGREDFGAGPRTVLLVAVTACGFLQAAGTVTHDEPTAAARLMVGLITGIGFLGAGLLGLGAILRSGRPGHRPGHGPGHGMALATGLCAAAAIGAASALHAYEVAAILAIATVAARHGLRAFTGDRDDSR